MKMLNEKSMLARLLPAVKLEVQEHSKAFTQTKSTQSSYTSTAEKAGYYPVGIAGWRLSGTGIGQIVPYACYLSARSVGSATVNFGLRNNNSNTDISGTFHYTILWQKR